MSALTPAFQFFILSNWMPMVTNYLRTIHALILFLQFEISIFAF